MTFDTLLLTATAISGALFFSMLATEYALTLRSTLRRMHATPTARKAPRKAAR